MGGRRRIEEVQERVKVKVFTYEITVYSTANFHENLFSYYLFCMLKYQLIDVGFIERKYMSYKLRYEQLYLVSTVENVCREIRIY